MSRDRLRIAIVGGGLGGLSAAALLQSVFDVNVYEQSRSFQRTGAGINLGPNMMHVLRRIGVADGLVRVGARPERWLSRHWSTGEVLLELKLGEDAERYYGEPYLTVHRGDFHATLLAAVAPASVHFSKRLVRLDPGAPNVLHFEDRTRAEADVVVGADGIWSKVREAVGTLDRPQYSGFVAFRGVIPAELYGPKPLADIVKWWADDRMFLAYPVSRSGDQMVFVTSTPQARWVESTSWVPSDRAELREACVGFHPEVQHIIDIAPTVTKWATFDNDPLPFWSSGTVVLQGDACHPMKPYLGQGAAMAIEDAGALWTAFNRFPTDPRRAIETYEQARRDRTASIQAASRIPTWLRDHADPDWVFAYNVFNDPLAASAA